MSRCLPFPPPGYSAKFAGSDTLIDSIKFRRETEKDAITERKKDRKREKKEKRVSKEREKEEATVLDQSRKRKHTEEKAHKLAKDTKLSKGKDIQNNDDSELLERSNITEEFGQPFCPQIPCTSDTSEDSNRRKRHCPNPPLETGIQAKGTILRIRLAPKKPETSPTVAPLKTKEELKPISTVTRNPNELRWQSNEPSSSRRNELTSREKKIQRVDLHYRELVENWVPSSFSSVESKLSDEDDDLGWLNESRVQRCKQSITDVHTSSSSSSSCATLWPQARFLPEVELYALPFTVPF